MSGPAHRRAARRLAALGLAAALALAGCSALPTSSAPERFLAETPSSDPLVLSGFGPEEGSSAQKLVSDFLRASAAGVSDDFATARLYLTGGARQSWQPLASAQIYSNDQVPSVHVGSTDRDRGRATVSVSATAIAGLDGSGVYSDAEGGNAVRRSFHLARGADGEWRIDKLDDGILVSESSFTSSFRQVNLYFLSPDHSALVADPRWLPLRRLASHLVAMLLAGPQDAIEPAVETAVPSGASLPTQGVDVSDGVAQVELTSGQPLDQKLAPALAWQLVRTLEQAPDVSSVRVTLNSSELGTSDLPSGPAYELGSAVAERDGQIVQVDGSSGQVLVGRSQLDGGHVASPAVDPVGGTTAAWLDGTGVSVLDRANGRRASVRVASPTAPSVDRYGWVWVASRRDGRVRVSAVERRTETLRGPFGSGDIADLRVSPDGARAAFVRASGSASTLWTCAIVRDRLGRPTGWGSPVRLGVVGSHVRAISWSGSQTLVVARADADGSLQVAGLGESVRALPIPVDAASVAAGAQPTSMYVQRADGTLYERAGSVWQNDGRGLAGVRFPG